MSRAALRESAREWRSALGLSATDLTDAERIIRLAADHTGLRLSALPPGDPLLSGAYGVLDRDAGIIWLDASLPKARRMAVAAHEYAHHVLHSDCTPAEFEEPDALDSESSSEPEAVAGYSPRQRREVDANVWALELLLPGPAIRAAFYDRGLAAEAISQSAGVTIDAVRVKMRACLLHAVVGDDGRVLARPAPAPKVRSEPNLDDSQRAAATVERGPFLLTAGPGAGKTRTLIARCAHLVKDRRIAPEKILALTFSRKAAAEMRERLIAAAVGGAASGPWVGTFHALCLDLLRRFPREAGLPETWSLIGETEAYGLLERTLPHLNLRELSDLARPTVHLRDILRTIARAKDELCGAERFAELARAHIDDCVGGSRSDEALRLAEAARVYEAYEGIKSRIGRLDFGDLLVGAVALLERNESVRRSVQHQFPHIVADEYQDINRASARLLKLLAGPDAAGLWAVGDRRQSIYRFRGASPANVAQFDRDYPGGSRGDLRVNYRSQPPIVRVFECVARRLSAAEPGVFVGWDCARRAESGTVRVAAAPDARAQAAGIAREIFSLRSAHVDYSDQAILCRTHAEAARLADLLIEANVPVLYVGNLLDRPVVKDLLCLLDAFAQRGSTGAALLLRLGRMAGGLNNPQGLLEWAAQTVHPPMCLGDRILSDSDVRSGEPRLVEMLAAVGEERGPSAVLTRFLFDRPTYLASLTNANGPGDLSHAVDLLAIRRLLDLASEHTAAYSREFSQIQNSDDVAPVDPITWFLTQLRRSAQSGERLSAAPDDDDAVDAVRLMTVHAAKGLEFSAVFMPDMSDGRFPSRDRTPFIIEPRGMCADRLPGEADRDEEACLFFVALSRARDHLLLSRADAQASGGRVEKPSPFLALIDPALRSLGTHAPIRWASAPSTSVSEQSARRFSREPSAATKPRFAASALELYRRCPRRYYYNETLGLRGADDRGAYGLYRECIKTVTAWMQDQWREVRVPGEAEVRAKALAIWAASGAPDDLYRNMFRARALEILLQTRTMYEARSKTQTPALDRILPVDIGNCVVDVAADLVTWEPSGVVHVVRHRDGRAGDQDHASPRLSLLRAGAASAFGGRAAEIEVSYARSNEVRTSPPSPRFEPGRILKYEEAAAGVLAGNFDPTPDSRQCPTCPFYLVCPE